MPAVGTSRTIIYSYHSACSQNYTTKILQFGRRVLNVQSFFYHAVWMFAVDAQTTQRIIDLSLHRKITFQFSGLKNKIEQKVKCVC